ncbi:MAG: polysaccharide lyase 6 family protein [Bacteroidales bacterium]|nr:polysaccharide lyase 6 family protein [Bacteroidales bacterium]
MKNTVVLLGLFFCISAIFATQTIVTSASQITNGSWKAGDTIVMKNGTWTNQTITLKAVGTASQPVVLQAETAGSVILSGTSKIGFSGKYLIISGLFFKNGTLSGSEVISFRSSSSEFAENCRLTNTTIVDYNPSDNTVDSKWVSLYGKNNTVDHCSFENKTNSGTLMVVWLQSGVIPAHIIDQNYFGYRNSNLDANGAELNGQEIIRVGDSSTSMQIANVTVTNNFFEHCNGEIEVISNKSCGNYYSNNLFFECKGMLTLRHGNGCTVDGNYFFGNGISSTGGVRIIGENHKVYNNYFDNLRGTDYRAALCIVRGKENSAPSEYFQVKNALVAFNTFVNCSQAFKINYNSSSLLTMPPIGTTIAHNHVYNSSSSNSNVNIDLTSAETMDVTWKNIIMNQGKYTNFSYTSAQVITGKDAKMGEIQTTTPMMEPGSNSQLANYTTPEFSEIITDVRGRSRGSVAKIPGASQLSGTVSRIMPLKTLVGAGYFNNPLTTINIQSQTNKINTYASNQQLTVDVDCSGELFVFDFMGRTVNHRNIESGVSIFPFEHKGVYLLSFRQNGGCYFNKKIVIK